MRHLGQLLLGLLAAAGSSLIILAAASLALVEGAPSIAEIPATTQAPIEPSPAPGETLAPTATRSTEEPQATATEYLPTACPAPAGWLLYVIQPGDTIESLAEQSKLSVEDFRRANCLTGNTLIPNSVLFMPSAGPTKTVTETLPTPLPTVAATITPAQCGPPYGWILYIVRPGDTIFRLSLAYGVSQEALMRANCMSSSRLLAGQTLFVPNVPTRVPTATKTPVPPTDEPTSEPTAEPTEEPTTEPTEEPTEEPTAEPTETEAPTAEPTEEPTETEAPTAEPTEAPTEATTEAPSETEAPVETEEPVGEG